MNLFLKGFRRFFLFVCATMLVLGSVGAAADTPPSPQVTNGIQWLLSQVQVDGSLLSEQTSLATALQNRTESTQTLKLLATVPTSLADAIAADTQSNTEYLARKAIALSLAGKDGTPSVLQLLPYQNSDGGFGGGERYASDPLATAWSVLALANTGKSDSNEAKLARSYLAAALQNDGGLLPLVYSSSSRLEASAITLLALQSGSDATTQTAARKVFSWLLASQAANGSWIDDTYLSALSLLAVAPMLTDTTVRANANTFLLAQQQTNGSWNGDAFMTAIVLRGLTARAGNSTLANPSVTGQVIDSATNQPLIDATVSVTGAASASVTTDANGRFALSTLVKGSYTIQYSRAGYANASGSFSLTAGQKLDVGVLSLTQNTTTGILRGQVTAASDGTPLAGALISVTGSVGLNVTTDSNGHYEFTGVAPGSITLTASLSGYQAATGSATLLAGQTLLFSPAMYVNGATKPDTGRFIGKVTAAGSGNVLAGVSVVLNGNEARTTGADGSFDFTLAPNTYTATYNLSGYNTATQSFVLNAGTIADAGVIPLSAIRTTTTVTGKIRNKSGVSIAAATVQVIGGDIATANDDGAYVLTNLTGNSFDLRISATGYSSKLLTLTVAKPAEVVQDFVLETAPSSSLTLGELSVSPASAGSNTDITVNTVVTNTASSAANGLLVLRVFDANNKLIGTGITYNSNGDLLGQFTVQAAQQVAAKLVWNTAQFPPASYKLLAQIVEPGSINQVNPLGTVLIERQASVTVTEQAHFTGSIKANPPVLRAGLNTPVQLSAVVQNDGNIDLPAQPYALRAINTVTSAVVMTQQVAADAMAVAGLQTLGFSDWTPSAAGNYRLELVGSDASEGLVTTLVYVGDSAKAAFTVDKLVVPAGTQNVRSKIKVTGQDIESGSISDPLAPLIKAAIKKSVAYGDSRAALWTATNRCGGCHIQTQALVGGELTRKFTTYNESDRRSNFNSISTYQQSDGTLRSSYPEFSRTQTMLGMWALSAWHKSQDNILTMIRGADYLRAQQLPAGNWTADHASGWWDQPAGNTAFNTKSLIDVSTLLKQAPAGSVVNYTRSTWVSGQGLSGAFFMTSDAQSNLYVSNYNAGTVLRIKPNGVVEPWMSGLGNVLGIVVSSDGTTYAASYSGLWRRTVDGVSTKLNTTRGDGLAMGPDGKLYMSNYSANTIYQVSTDGQVSTYLSGGLLNGPEGIAFSPSGDMLVTNWNSTNILRIHPDKSVEVVVSWVNGNPRAVVRAAGAWWVGTTTGVYRYDDEWHGQRLTFQDAEALSVLPDGRILSADTGSTVYVNAPVAFDVNAKLAGLDLAIGKGVTWLLSDANFNTSSNLDMAHKLIGLDAALQYYKGKSQEATIQAKMRATDTLLRSRQLSDGGWGKLSSSTSDSLVTSQVGVALDSLHPSPDDPALRKAVQLLLSRQQADGSWRSENGVLNTNLGATTWVEIWLPIILNRLGGIDTSLSVTFPANVTMSNADVLPVSTQPNTDGTTTYQWKMVGVTSEGREVNFDLALADMAVNEDRPVATDAHLTFNNTFTKKSVDAPITIPRVKASAFLGLGVTTDKTEYTANSTVSITAQVKNTANNISSGSVKFELFAPDGVRIADLGTQTFNNLSSSASVNLVTAWNTDTTLAGSGYYVLASLFDSASRASGTARSLFKIVNAEAGAALASSRVTTDKTSYLPSETVRVTSRLTNLTANQYLNDLVIITTVTGPDGTTFWTHSENIAQLIPGDLKDYNYSIPLNYPAAGSYTTTLVVKDSSGTVLSTTTSSFTVQTSAVTGIGLQGTLTLLPAAIPQGDPLSLLSGFNNVGNAALSGVPITLSIVDPEQQKVIATLPYSLDIGTGQQRSWATTWTVDGPVGATYVAVLSAAIGGKSLTLAQDKLTILPPPIKLDVQQTFGAQARVLILLSCYPGWYHEGYRADQYTHPCFTERTNFVDSLLNQQNIPHLVTYDLTTFTKAFRSGSYNSYWLLGATVVPDYGLAEEIREAVFRGDTLLLDSGLYDHRNFSLLDIVGARYTGLLYFGQQTMTITGPLYTPAVVNVTGNPLRMTPTTGVVQATYSSAQLLRAEDDDGHLGGDYNGSGQDSEAGHRPATYPAMVSNTYGLGRALMFNFDIVPSLKSGSSVWNAVVPTTLTNLTPDTPALYAPGSRVAMTTAVKNLAREIDVNVAMTLPAGIKIASSNPVAKLDTSGNPSFAFTLPADQTKLLNLLLIAPASSVSNNTTTIQTTVTTTRSGVTKKYGDYSFAFTVSGSATLPDRIASELQALNLTTDKERTLRTQSIERMRAAIEASKQARYDTAIYELTEATKALRQITSVNITPYRVELDRLMQEMQIKWVPPAR